MAFTIRPKTRIKPNEQLVTIDTLRVGDFVKVQAIHLDGETSLHITMLEGMTPQCEPGVERQFARDLCTWSAMTLSATGRPCGQGRLLRNWTPPAAPNEDLFCLT
jgi:hypothetical protein